MIAALRRFLGRHLLLLGIVAAIVAPPACAAAAPRVALTT